MMCVSIQRKSKLISPNRFVQTSAASDFKMALSSVRVLLTIWSYNGALWNRNSYICETAKYIWQFQSDSCLTVKLQKPSCFVCKYIKFIAVKCRKVQCSALPNTVGKIQCSAVKCSKYTALQHFICAYWAGLKVTLHCCLDGNGHNTVLTWLAGEEGEIQCLWPEEIVLHAGLDPPF